MSYNFLDFLKLCFKTVSPNNQIINNWHIQIIADRLEAALNGKINRLIINMPPRFIKSICVSIAWPSWIFGLNPQARIIVASYSQILSERLSLDNRHILQSEWYKKLFPHVILSKDQNTKRKFQTTQRGYRFATSVGGSITGEGGDILIIDDPMNPMQALSKTYRQRVCHWFEQSFMTRLNDRKNSIVVIVMHRLHTDDLTGYLLSKKTYNKWHILSLPIIAEKNNTFYSITSPWKFKHGNKIRNVLHIRKEGDPLYKKHGKKYIEELKSDLGSYAFAAQCQQHPIHLSSGIIKYKWIQRYSSYNNEDSNITQSWDTASSSNKKSNYSVCTTWSYKNNCFFLLEVYKVKLEYQQLKQAIINLANHWKPNAILIEKKASGLQIIQELSSISTTSIIGIVPTANKVTRFYKIIPIFESRKIFLPYDSPWLSDFEQELLSFPNTQNDDQIDSMTQYLHWFNNKIKNTFTIREI
ncbi:phage terminase large subunit [Ehrlichia muris]|uniref:phage terminase large subunit n=1 Tax=Ehrlichia muris TaxID=35795 RepID=UPI0037C1AEFB